MSYHQPTFSSTFHLSFLAPLTWLVLVSFRFISSRFVLSHLRLVSFHFVLRRAWPSALRCAKTRAVSDAFLSFPYFFSPHRSFLFDGSLSEAPSDGSKKRGGEVLGFIPVVNNIFIAASSEEKCGVRSAIPGDVCRSRARRRRGTIVSERLTSRSS